MRTLLISGRRRYALLALLGAAASLAIMGASCAPTKPPPPFPTPCPVTTLEEIAAGNFPTAIDKQGTGGTCVTVLHLQVLKVVLMHDGDWHVDVTDGTIPIFVTEIIPSDQQREGMPPVGAFIDETGTPYDDLTATSADHQFTPWEIHPVTAWTLSQP